VEKTKLEAVKSRDFHKSESAGAELEEGGGIIN
jgi:hypothetical protein